MRLSNKSTFSLICLILLAAFVSLPVMAETGGPAPAVTVKPPVTATDIPPGTDTYKYNSATKKITLPETGEKMFNLFVKFSEDVFSAAGTKDQAPAEDQDSITAALLLASDLSFRIINSKGQEVYALYADTDATVSQVFQTDFTAEALAAETVTVEVEQADLSVGTITLESTDSKRGWIVPITLEEDLLTAVGDEDFSLNVTVGADFGAYSKQTVMAATNTEPTKVTAVGKQNQASSTADISIMQDLGLPTLMIMNAAGTGDDDGLVIFTFTFNEPTATTDAPDPLQAMLTASDLVINNGIIRSFVKQVPDTNRPATDTSEVWKLKLAPVVDTEPIVVALGYQVVTDLQGNYVPSQVSTYTPPDTVDPVDPVDPTDENPPTVMIKAPEESEADKSLVFTITFNEALTTTGVNAFTVEDLEISNATSKTLTMMSGNKVYKLTIVPANPDFPVEVEFMKDAKVADASNNLILMAGFPDTATYFPPGVLGVGIDAPDMPEIDGRLKFTFTFAEEIANSMDGIEAADPQRFTTDDILVSNAEDLVEANLKVSLKDSKIYTLLVKPVNPRLSVTVQLIPESVSNGKMDDERRLSATNVEDTYEPDITAPTITSITHTPADGTALAADKQVVFTITFSEALGSGTAGLLASEIMVTNGTAGTLTQSGNVYTFNVTATDPMQSVTITVPTTAVADIAGNALAAAMSEVYMPPTAVVDNTPPKLTITHAPLDGMALPLSGMVTFTFRFNEALGSGDDAFTVGDITVANGRKEDFVPAGVNTYKLTVTPTDAMQDVTVTVAKTAVQDTSNNALAADVTDTYMADDTVAPTVVISSAMGKGDNADKIVFTFTFSEPLEAGSFTSEDLIRGTGVTLAGNPTVDPTNNKVYTVLVNPSTSGDTILTLKTGSVMDMQGNALDGDETWTHVPPTPNRAPAFASGASISAITATTGTAISNVTLPAATDADTDDTLTYSITPALPAGLAFNATSRVLSGTPSAAMAQTSYTYKVSDGTLSATLMFNITVNTAISLDEVATATSSAVITIQPESFVVVVRNKNALNNQGIAFRSDVTVVEWGTMPNLERLFYRGNTGIILGNGGGGALILKESAAQTKDRRQGSVGISEIMWGIDAGYLGDETREKSGQWIELHNLNAKVEDNAATAAVNEFDNGVAKVVLSWKTGRNITSDSTLIGNLSNPTLDVVTNFFNNRPGSPAWDVKGNSGDSVAGVNFKSMARILPDKKSKYANADGSRFDNRDGRNAGHWQASSSAYLTARTTRTDTTDVVYQYLGTPGRVNHASVDKQPNTIAGRTNVPSNTIVINEVGNNSNDDYDWVEIRNVSDGEINLKNYLITMVRDSNTETVLARFPANDSAKLAKDDVFLLLKTDPATKGNHPIAATGYNVGLSLEEQQPGTPNSPVRYRVFSSLTLPNDDGQKFVLIVRKPDSGHNNGPGGHKDQGTSETASTAHGPDLQHIVDVAGYDDNVNKSNYPNAVSNTSLWPLHNFAAPRSAKNTFKNGVVLQRNRLTTKHGLGGTGIEGDDGNKPAFGIRGWTGVGYRRAVSNTGMHGGTPGYPNGASHGAGTTIITAVYISEIMYTDARNGTLPQWIEIRNTSNTEGADLHNWRLTIKNHADKTTFEDGEWDGKYEASVLLRDLKIKPNSSVLVTSRKGPRSDVHLADNEIFSLFPSRRSAFGMTNANSDVINPFGFRITLHANGHEGDRNKWQLVDDVGNLATPNPRDRRGNNERLDMPRWALPDAVDEAGNRSSIARRNNKVDGLLDGSMASAWVLSSMDNRTHEIDSVYYGHIGDMSTPGQTKGSPLPVRLSFFRPTLEDGKVVIRWTTESELDNAGFNILRSQDRNGEFTQVNDQLIQGKGTTAERSNYKWVDTSAKPGAVYYYQIEDVSFAGERQTLTTTKMKGLISAKNKLTTKWGELKEVQ